MNCRATKKDAPLAVIWGFVGGTLMAMILFMFMVNTAWSADEEGCLLCHGLVAFGLQTGNGYRSLYVEEAQFNSSKHYQIRCRGCHQTVVSLPHDPLKEKVNCGLECHAMVGPSAIPYSHESLYWNFLGSVHGQRSRMAITCLDCHLHNPPVQGMALTPRERADVCSNCHLDNTLSRTYGLDIQHVRNYFQDVHGRMVLAGSFQAPSCTDCHSRHSILQSEQDDSTTHATQRAATCAGSAAADSDRTCHMEASSSWAAGMSPLIRQSLNDFRVGSLLYFFGLLLSGGLLFRIILGVFFQR